MDDNLEAFFSLADEIGLVSDPDEESLRARKKLLEKVMKRLKELIVESQSLLQNNGISTTNRKSSITSSGMDQRQNQIAPQPSYYSGLEGGESKARPWWERILSNRH